MSRLSRFQIPATLSKIAGKYSQGKKTKKSVFPPLGKYYQSRANFVRQNSFTSRIALGSKLIDSTQKRTVTMVIQPE